MSTRKIYAGPAKQGSQTPSIGEAKAESAILPGHIVQLIGVAGSETVQPNELAATVFGKANYVAEEIGSHYGATIDTAYEAGENVKFIKVRSGEFVWVKADAGVSLVEGTTLSASTTAGQVKEAVLDGTEQIQFRVAEGNAGLTVANAGDLILVEPA